ncbi:MAG TPA: translation initiation factor IF-2 N-terminal domain-containing protein, partial [Acidimicrobiales bacterium]|nr:translation initiation factor IF-2 N-terminal domain-containing protein [Acidimicrobiales bacterium]
MAKKIRVYELARELGLTNKEALDLCESLGIGVRSHSSSIEDAQADRVRRKADREGLRRDVSPEEPVKAKATKAPVAEPAPRPEPATPVPAPAGQERGPVAPPEPSTDGAPARPAPAPSGRDPRLIVSRPAPPLETPEPRSRPAPPQPAQAPRPAPPPRPQQ